MAGTGDDTCAQTAWVGAEFALLVQLQNVIIEISTGTVVVKDIVAEPGAVAVGSIESCRSSNVIAAEKGMVVSV